MKRRKSSMGKTGDIERVHKALVMLSVARDLLAEATAPKALARVELAISSCKGALRNAEYRRGRRDAIEPPLPFGKE